MCKAKVVKHDKRLSLLTKAELIKLVQLQSKRLVKAKFYYRQQRDKIDKLVVINNKALDALRKPVK